jgi:hypothetical protein
VANVPSWHVSTGRRVRYTQSEGAAYERVAAGRAIIGEPAHNDSQGTLVKLRLPFIKRYLSAYMPVNSTGRYFVEH